jgi:hypothetical protein
MYRLELHKELIWLATMIGKQRVSARPYFGQFQGRVTSEATESTNLHWHLEWPLPRNGHFSAKDCFIRDEPFFLEFLSLSWISAFSRRCPGARNPAPEAFWHSTQAALIEEMAAAASILKTQAQELVHVVDTFKLGTGDPIATPSMQTIAPTKSAVQSVYF